MPIDLGLLGKLLALSRSDEPAEAALALSRFHTAINRWCTDNGMPAGTGYVTLAEPDNAACKLAEILAQQCDARVLALEPFELIAVGSESDCRWIWWWFSNAYSEIEKTARRANFRERHLFMHGAIMGLAQALQGSRSAPSDKRIERPDRRADSPETKEGAAPPTPAAPPPLSQPQRSTLNDGTNFGLGLGRRLAELRKAQRLV